MMFDQLPPHDEVEEKTVLATCIVYSAEAAIDILSASDFYDPINQKIFSAVKALQTSNQTPDVAAVYTQLQSTTPDENWPTILAETIDFPIAVDPTYSSKKVKKLSIARAGIRICHETISRFHAQTLDISETVESLQKDALELGSAQPDQKFCTIQDMLLDAVTRYEEFGKNNFGDSVPTGFQVMDKILKGGFRGSKLIIVAARPGIGKTSFLCNMSANIARKGHMVGIFTMEQDKEDLADKWFASESRINSVKFQSGEKLDDEDWQRIHAAARRQHKWPILVDDTGGLTITELKRRCRMMKKAGCKIIFIDQLSQIRSENKRLSVFEANTNHVEEMNFLKKELRMPIVLLAQLNRELEKRADKRPMLSDLKNTGMLEEAADMVFLGYRPFPYTKKEEDRTAAQWDLQKHRGGPTWTFHMHWDDKTTTFYEIERF